MEEPEAYLSFYSEKKNMKNYYRSIHPKEVSAMPMIRSYSPSKLKLNSYKIKSETLHQFQLQHQQLNLKLTLKKNKHSQNNFKL